MVVVGDVVSISSVVVGVVVKSILKSSGICLPSPPGHVKLPANSNSGHLFVLQSSIVRVGTADESPLKKSVIFA